MNIDCTALHVSYTALLHCSLSSGLRGSANVLFYSAVLSHGAKVCLVILSCGLCDTQRQVSDEVEGSANNVGLLITSHRCLEYHDITISYSCRVVAVVHRERRQQPQPPCPCCYSYTPSSHPAPSTTPQAAALPLLPHPQQPPCP